MKQLVLPAMLLLSTALAADELCHKLNRQVRAFTDFKETLGPPPLTQTHYEAMKSRVNKDLSGPLKDAITACRASGTAAVKSKCEAAYQQFLVLSTASKEQFHTSTYLTIGTLTTATTECKKK